ncbi:N-methyl-l-tryptophan oxidase [Rhodosalinus halophilus]|uniref:N-methyl-l-tryptophan oxidase n=1 Tax=Rhodosalinus halophilus TaxID=2259333 RepID=A0A365UB86_9RHOB|nr:FAD-dependent oxidoreductase [Rhodosalinus halophilus]RBI86306.1 N-methyl-l-tryptophan oxidase [Rhodosalinus halophilus]
MRVAVIGAGLIGGAAARHLATAGHAVTLIGPNEPADKRAHRGVFASHYDEGRITRRLDPAEFWSRVSRASIDRYAEIEAASGVSFHSPVGAMLAGPERGAAIRSTAAVQAAAGFEAETLRAPDLARSFPYFAFPDTTLALHEMGGAGHISPRRLAVAQRTAALRAGARHVSAEATGIEKTAGGIRIATGAGEVEADRVLVATGGFTDGLLPGLLPLSVYARTVARFEVDKEEAARLDGMPALIWLENGGEAPYLLPPIRYPDGRIYLKLGGDPEDVALHGATEIGDWFRSGGSAEVGARLEAMVRDRMPGLAIRRVVTDACVTTYTPADRPAIGRVSARVAVAVAGCGRGAKCSDELGRLGALAVLGEALPDWAEVQDVAPRGGEVSD